MLKWTTRVLDPEIVEMVRFLDPEIVEMVDRSYIQLRLISKLEKWWKTIFNERQTIVRQPEMRSSFNQLLVVLALLDTVFLVTSIWDSSFMKIYEFNSEIYAFIFPKFWWPMRNIVTSWIIFLIMGLATERYLAVCR